MKGKERADQFSPGRGTEFTGGDAERVKGDGICRRSASRRRGGWVGGSRRALTEVVFAELAQPAAAARRRPDAWRGWSGRSVGSDTVGAGAASPYAHRRGRRRLGAGKNGRGATHLYALSCMPVRTSHACTGPSALLPVSTTSSRKLATAVIVGARRTRGSVALCPPSVSFSCSSRTRVRKRTSERNQFCRPPAQNPERPRDPDAEREAWAGEASRYLHAQRRRAAGSFAA